MKHLGAVLVVDDQPERADHLVRALEDDQHRYEIIPEAPDLEAVLGPDSPWDCIICHVELLNVSWASVRRAMRNFDVQVPVMAVSDHRDMDSMTTALGLGATHFFVKPAEKPGLVRRAIERSVHHRKLQRDLKESNDNLERANTELSHSLRILEQDQAAGRQVQKAMFPAHSLQTGEYWFSHRILPSLYLSGDFADYFEVGQSKVVFFLADVSGHGSSSAFATVLLKNLFARKRSDFLRRGDATVIDPIGMLKLANRELMELHVNKYATMVVACLDVETHELSYSVAGHLPKPVLITPGTAEYLPGEGMPVGLTAEANYTLQHIALPETFMLVLMSDGVLETIANVDLIQREKVLLERLSGPLEKPGDLIRRLDLGEVTSDDLVDDIAGLFVSRGVG
jgi:sigma-B regulation protein RsbU (phosphoserine phosphatase)